MTISELKAVCDGCKGMHGQEQGGTKAPLGHSHSARRSTA